MVTRIFSSLNQRILLLPEYMCRRIMIINSLGKLGLLLMDFFQRSKSLFFGIGEFFSFFVVCDYRLIGG